MHFSRRFFKIDFSLPMVEAPKASLVAFLHWVAEVESPLGGERYQTASLISDLF